MEHLEKHNDGEEKDILRPDIFQETVLELLRDHQVNAEATNQPFVLHLIHCDTLTDEEALYIIEIGDYYTQHARGLLSPIEISDHIRELFESAVGSPDQNDMSYADIQPLLFPVLISEKTLPPTPEDEHHAWKALAGDLRIYYSLYQEHRLSYIRRARVSAWGITPRALHEQALENLRGREFQFTEFRDEDIPGPGLLSYIERDRLAAARLLLMPEYVDHCEALLGGDPTFAVPNQDILLATSIPVINWMLGFSTMTQHVRLLNERGLSEHLFRVKDGKVVSIGTAFCDPGCRVAHAQ